MKILITGATGLIGSELVKECRSRNIEVHYLSTSKEKLVDTPGYHGFYWNPEEDFLDPECFKGVEAIVNLAGTNIARKWTPEHKKEIIDSRISSLLTLKRGLERQSTHQVRHLVSASAIGVYPSSLSAYYEESNPHISQNFLGTVVKRWEEAADSFKDLGIPVAKIRVGLVLDQQDGALAKIAKPIKYFVGAPLGSGEQWQSWIHKRDIAKMFLTAILDEWEGVFNGVAPNPVTNKKLTRATAAVLNKPLFLPPVPALVLKLLLGEMAILVLDSQRVSSKKAEEHGFVFEFVNLEAALSDLYS